MFWCVGDSLARLTITLPDTTHRALKEAAARQNRTIGDIIGESLEAYGIKGEALARSIVQRARKRAALSEKEALRIAVAETRARRR